MTYRLVLSLCASVLAVGVAGAPAFSADKPAEVMAPRAPRVTVAIAERGELVETVILNGTLVARDEVMVGPEIEGVRVIEILAEEGDKVQKGQVLARLSRETLDTLLAQNDAVIARGEAGIAQARSQISQSDANLKQARQQLDRSKELRKSGFVPQATFDQQTNDLEAKSAQLSASRDALRVSEADLANLQAQRRELMVRIGRTEVRSPAAGTVSRRSVKLGAVASMAAEPMYRLIADSDIELEGEVPEFRISKVKVGQPASVVANDLTVSGSVRLVSPEVDKLTRLGRVRVAVGPDGGLRVGAFARGSVETKRVMAIAIPVSAILYGDKGPFVQVVDKDHIVSTPVTLGIIADNRAEIISGMSEGMQFVVKAGAFLRDGDAVTPQMMAKPQAAISGQVR